MNLGQVIDYETIFRMSPDARLIIDNYRIIDINIAALKMFGYESKDILIGKEIFTLSPLIQPDGHLSIHKGKEIIDKLKFGEVNQFEWIHVMNTGENFIVEVAISLHYTNGRKILHSSLRDITDRKKKEIELLESENLYKSMFQKSNAVLLLVHCRNGAIIDANSTACKFYGYKKEELTTLKFKNIVLDCKNLTGCKTSSEFIKHINNNQRKHILSNGQVRDVHTYCNLVQIKNEDYLNIIIFDITDKIIAIKDLNESRKKYKMLFNNINDAIFLHGLNENQLPSNFIEVNSTACRRLEYSREELLSISPLDIDPSDEIEKHKVIRKILSQGHSTFESTHITKSGKQIPVEINTHLININNSKFILSISRDISERKAVEEEKQRSYETHRSLMEFFPSAVFILDKSKFIYTNPIGVKVLGLETPEDLIGKEFYEFIELPSRHNFKKQFNLLYKKEKSHIHFEGKLLSIDDTVIDVDVTATFMPYKRNRSSIIVVIKDITEKNKAEKLMREAIENEKLRTEFFANISHELRTPLNVVLGGLQLIELNSKENNAFSDTSNEKLSKYLFMTKQNCYRLLRIINNIIDITKIDSGYFNINLSNYDIVHIVRNITLSVYDYLIQKNIDLSFNTEIPEKVIALDCDAIERIILNLLSNAMKFTPSGGKIKVNIHEIKRKIVIIVSDNGIGIKNDSIATIFDRFSQIDKSLTRNHEGSGIGLALVKHLVEAHKGKVSVESIYGKGTKFIIELPNTKIANDNHNTRPKVDFGPNVERIRVEFSDIYIS